MKTGIYQLTEDDRPNLVQHLLRLSSDDRRTRFFCAFSNSAIESFVKKLDLARVYGFFIAGRLIAASMLMPEDASTLEFAVSVDREHRGRGMARHLLQHGLSTVWADRAEKVVIRHTCDNAAMAAVRRGLPARVTSSAGEVDAVIDLGAMQQLEHGAMSRLVGQEA